MIDWSRESPLGPETRTSSVVDSDEFLDCAGTRTGCAALLSTQVCCTGIPGMWRKRHLRIASNAAQHKSVNYLHVSAEHVLQGDSLCEQHSGPA